MSDEPQKLPEAKSSDSAPPVWNQQIAEMIFKAIDGSSFTRRCSRPVQGLDSLIALSLHQQTPIA
ncbi:MAG: hypothetical protein LH702_05785, partial [Phormidesmis sp. CAN_BIN44]|nr:hypothetical protein [Phormidesmis sp. CAN_BIN44]